MDQQVDKDGNPCGPKRFKEIVKECWFISDNLHTSYSDVLDMSFQERFYLIELINEKHEATKKEIERRQEENRLKNGKK